VQASASSIICDPATSFDITHHLGLNAKKDLEFDCKSLLRPYAAYETKPQSEELSQHIFSLPKGVFLRAGNHLKKAGKVIAEHGSVVLSSEGKLQHVGLTESGLEKNDALQLKASKMLGVDGYLKSQGLLGIESSQNLELSSNSQIEAKDIKLQSGNNLNLKGTLRSSNTLEAFSDQDILFSPTSSVKAQHINLKAKNTINSEGIIEAEESLRTKSSFFYNTGYLMGGDSHFKVDRLFSNAFGGIIEGNNTTIDTFINVSFGGSIDSHKLSRNSILDINLAGVQSAFNASINSLVSLDYGSLSVPRIDSWEDIFNSEKLKSAGSALFTTFAPQHLSFLYNVAQAACKIPELFQKARELKEKYAALCTAPQKLDHFF
jgi:hypothetical protein